MPRLLQVRSFFPFSGFLFPHAVPEGAQLFAQAQVLAVAVHDQLCFVQAELSVFIQQALIHIAGHDFGQEQVMAAQRDDLRDPAFQIDRALLQDGAVGQNAARGGMELAGGKLVVVAAALHAAPVHRTHQLFSGQIDGKLSALLDEVVAVPLGADADGYHAGLGADGACPADGDEVGLLQPTAGDQHRRFRVQQGAAPPALFAHP